MSEGHTCNQGDRFDSIEEKLDQITELLVAVAKNDTSILQLQSDKKDHEERIRKLERTMSSYSLILKWIERIAWIALLGGLGLAKYIS